MSGMLSLRSPFDRLRVSGKERIPLRQRALDADGAGHGLARGAEGDHEAVADCLYFAAAVLLHLLPHELLVGAQHIPRSLITPTRGQAGGADDVRKQDDDGAFGQLFGHSAPYLWW